MFDFSEQVVMVTGGTGNLGGPVARAFAKAGARLIVVDRDAPKQQAAFAAWVDDTRHWLAAPVDVINSAAATSLVQTAVQRFGKIDVLVNTVGGYRGGKPLHEAGDATWELMINLNARSVWSMCEAVIPQMLAQGAGKVINVGSRAATVGNANQAAYAAAKAAVARLTESLAAEVRAQGINVNCVLPATIDTLDNRAAMPKADTDKWVQPESLAEVILFLASPAARDIHGASIPIYGLG